RPRDQPLRRQNQTPVRAIGGDEDLAVAGVDRGNQKSLEGFREMRGGERGQCRDADSLDLERPGDRLGGGEADSDSRERAGPHRRRNAIERSEASLGLSDQAFDERQQRLRMSALHRDVLKRDRRGGAEIEHTTRDGGKSRVDGKNSHKRKYDKFGGGTKAARTNLCPRALAQCGICEKYCASASISSSVRWRLK